MAVPENLQMIAPGVWVDPALLEAAHGDLPEREPGVDRGLEEDHPMWDHASGGSRDVPGRRWTMNDLAEAAITLGAIDGKKAGVFFGLLLDHPGRLFTSAELIAAAPAGTFASPYAIAGSLNGFRKHVERAGRVYPFHWWEGDAHGTPTRYAVRPSVAAVFNAARQR